MLPNRRSAKEEEGTHAPIARFWSTQGANFAAGQAGKQGRADKCQAKQVVRGDIHELSATGQVQTIQQEPNTKYPYAPTVRNHT
jgi:hypothetical protein